MIRAKPRYDGGAEPMYHHVGARSVDHLVSTAKIVRL